MTCSKSPDSPIMGPRISPSTFALTVELSEVVLCRNPVARLEGCRLPPIMVQDLLDACRTVVEAGETIPGR